MPVLSINDVLSERVNYGETVALAGWVKTRRDSKAGISFIHMNDGSCLMPLQIVVNQDLANYHSDVLKLTTGCAIHVTGELVVSQGKGQSSEVHAHSVEVVGWVEQPESYPLAAKRHTLEHLREFQHLRARTNTFTAMSRIRHVCAMAIHEFFDHQGFYWLQAPIITACDAEGAGELFTVSNLDLMNLPRTDDGQIDFSADFFGRQAYLSVSGQLSAEAYSLALSKVYTFGPTFRAENSNTTRHLAEFWMVEPEIAFADLNDNALLAESLLKAVFRQLLERCGEALAFFSQHYQPNLEQRLTALCDESFERMTYTQAINYLTHAKADFQYPVSWGVDLQTEHERYLAETLLKRPVVITDYPKSIKAFYMRLNDDDKTVAAMDVLVPGIGEIIGGSQREERLSVLDARMASLELAKADYNWYRDLRRYGSVPHAGFGLGFERLMSYVTGVSNIRDIIPFPRTPKHVGY